MSHFTKRATRCKFHFGVQRTAIGTFLFRWSAFEHSASLGKRQMYWTTIAAYLVVILLSGCDREPRVTEDKFGSRRRRGTG
jgi:hypothetical protein